MDLLGRNPRVRRPPPPTNTPIVGLHGSRSVLMVAVGRETRELKVFDPAFKPSRWV